MRISENIADKIYDILVEIGASERMRKCFILTHAWDDDQHEWRFEGKLGFGGKFWNDWLYLQDKPIWRVNCYSEDETPERLEIIEKTNEKLQKLADSI